MELIILRKFEHNKIHCMMIVTIYNQIKQFQLRLYNTSG